MFVDGAVLTPHRAAKLFTYFLIYRLSLPSVYAKNEARRSNKWSLCWGLLSSAGIKRVPEKSTVLQREGQSGPGCQSCASSQARTPWARPDLPPVRPGLGKTRPLCVPLRCGQRCVLVSVSWCFQIMRSLSSQFKEPQMVLTAFKPTNYRYLWRFSTVSPPDFFCFLEFLQFSKNLKEIGIFKYFMLLAQHTFAPD